MKKLLMATVGVVGLSVSMSAMAATGSVMRQNVTLNPIGTNVYQTDKVTGNTGALVDFSRTIKDGVLPKTMTCQVDSLGVKSDGVQITPNAEIKFSADSSAHYNPWKFERLTEKHDSSHATSFYVPVDGEFYKSSTITCTVTY